MLKAASTPRSISISSLPTGIQSDRLVRKETLAQGDKTAQAGSTLFASPKISHATLTEQSIAITKAAKNLLEIWPAIRV
jgi:hypothetical protein